MKHSFQITIYLFSFTILGTLNNPTGLSLMRLKILTMEQLKMKKQRMNLMLTLSPQFLHYKVKIQMKKRPVPYAGKLFI